MLCANLNFNVDVNRCFGGLWKSRRRHKTGIKIGPFGGAGTRNFDTGGSAAPIARVKLRTGTVIYSLQISYNINRRDVETDLLGGEGGDSHHTFELRPGEYINSMTGCVREYNGETCITKLEFYTNLNVRHGPFGKADGRKFNVPVINGRIVGFFGRYSKYLNEIGVYLAPN
ncbi:agglutinin-like [Zingiber officinale]|uniref:Jacalin-type lectin domain-containing protein n=1 Tax=Zingiber officinale TaxID=94328 RepID=A0A8J5HES7_ZINOF|nr:agglutinin-like [Zingiber officinale]KAG6526761.1 hypothetical protein ZIOFF_016762 [Zingiber officinale]